MISPSYIAPTSTEEVVSRWYHKQLRLLQLERDAERGALLEVLNKKSSEQCEEAGLSLLSLECAQISTSLYGRTTYQVERRDKKFLPAHSFKVGDECVLYSPQLRHSPEFESSSVEGIVTKVTTTMVEFVADGKDDVDLFSLFPLRLDLLYSEKTYVKMVEAIKGVYQCNFPRCQPLRGLIFGKDCVVVVPHPIVPYNKRLNESQAKAVEIATSTESIAIIHGPPGTGKTTVVIEIIRQYVARGLKVGCFAPSNVAIDNIVEKLDAISKEESKSKFRMIRLGHPARINSDLSKYSLDSLVIGHEGSEIVSDIRKEIDSTRRKLHRTRESRKQEISDLKEELKFLRKEVKRREDQVVEEIMKSRNVVLSTCVGASSRLLNLMEFDVVLIDEAAQALEASCWIPIKFSNKVILAGDHCQLPPTVKSVEAEKDGLGVTLFEKLIKEERFQECCQMLEIQYRMNDNICLWASNQLYGGRLKSAENNANHKISSLPNYRNSETFIDDDIGDVVLQFIDTSGCSMEEEISGESRRNIHEVSLVKILVKKLFSIGIHASQIGIITPYNGQLELLRNAFLEQPLIKDIDAGESVEFFDLCKALEVRTVDGFQGGEKEIIIISLVRSNPNQTVGFLSEKRRINVAVTRAKRHLTIVGDYSTCSTDTFLRSLLDHVSLHGEHRSAMEYVRQDVVHFTQQAADTFLNLKVCQIPPIGGMDVPIFPSNLPSCTSKKLAPTKKSKITKEIVKNAPTSTDLMPTDDLFIKSKPQHDNENLKNLLLAFIWGRINGGSIGNNAFKRIITFNPSYNDEENDYFYAQFVTPKHNNQPRSLAFPVTLSSYERSMIHELCEKLNITKDCHANQVQLIHSSSGEEGRRFIQVSITSFEQTTLDNVNLEEIMINSPKCETTVAREFDMKRKQILNSKVKPQLSEEEHLARYIAENQVQRLHKLYSVLI